MDQQEICDCTIPHGYLLSEFFKVSGTSRPRVMIVFSEEGVLSANANVANCYANLTRLFAEEIELVWHVPPEQRVVSLSYDRDAMKRALAKTGKRDQYRLTVVKNASQWSLCIAKEDREADRTKLQPVPAQELREDEHDEVDRLLAFEDTRYEHRFSIRTKVFASVLSSFKKIGKQGRVLLCIFPGEAAAGLLFYHAASNTYERCGEVPEDVDIKGLSERHGEHPNVFLLTPELIGYLTRLPIHAEGSVRVYYSEGEPLKLAHTFGAFGCTSAYVAKIEEKNN